MTADVLCYTVGMLSAPLFLCGRVHAMLHAEVDQPSFDLSVMLSTVAPDGRAWTLRAGRRRCDAGASFSAEAERVTSVSLRHGGTTPSRLCTPEGA